MTPFKDVKEGSQTDAWQQDGQLAKRAAQFRSGVLPGAITLNLSAT
jgi:hypothetical protein